MQTGPNFKAFVQAMNATFPGIACPWNTIVQVSTLKVSATQATGKVDVTIYQLQNNQWEVFISVYQGGMIYDYTIPYKNDHQIAKNSVKWLKNHGM